MTTHITLGVNRLRQRKARLVRCLRRLSSCRTNQEMEIAVRKMLKRLAPLGVALAAMAAVLFAAPAAHAAAAPGEVSAAPGEVSAAPGDVSAYDVVNTFRNQATGNCLTGFQQGADTRFCDPSDPRQQWWVHIWRDGTRELKNVYYNNCLDDSAIGLLVNPCNASPAQSWFVHPWADGTIELKNQATRRCLDDSQGSTVTLNCNSSTYQSWF